MTVPHPLALGRHRLLICLGPGGVGKTTLSAALAVREALRGRPVDVMTVDPAPRLLDALGLDNKSSMPQPVGLNGLGAKRGGRLRALKLDPKRTFDELIERHAPSAAVRDAILADRIYRNLSNALAGVADYMAMERLLQLYLEETTALVVLDTPPAHEALDFLDAPRRMLDLLSSRAITLLGASRGLIRGPFGMLDVAARAVLAAFDRLTGLHLLSDIQAFVSNFEGMYAGFADRAAHAQELIRADSSFLVLITTAERERVAQAREFVEALDKLGLMLDAVVVNRVMEPLPEAAEIDRAALPATLRRKLARNLEDFMALKRRENASLEVLRAVVPPDTLMLVAPDFGHPPQTLPDLAGIADSLRPA